jgi:CheY-like chemotaxis protein
MVLNGTPAVRPQYASVLARGGPTLHVWGSGRRGGDWDNEATDACVGRDRLRFVWIVVYRPDHAVSRPGRPGEAVSRSGRSSLMPMTPARFLIVDDDAGVRDAFAHALRLEGYTVRTAATAAAALDEVATWRPDAILVDYAMGLINGLGFLYRLRAHESAAHTPVAVITGRVDVEGALATECADLDAAVYFKPLHLDDLRAIARGLLSKTSIDRSCGISRRGAEL